MPVTREDTSNELVPIRAGRYLATISAPPDVAEQVRSALCDLIRRDRSPHGASIVIRPSTTGHRLTVDGVGWEPPTEQSALDQLIYVLLRATLDAEPELLHLHAGYVAIHGNGVLIAGFPGSGKSTLVATLVEHGFDYLTDERVGVDRALRLWPLPKPISLVRSSFDLVPRLDPQRPGATPSDQLWHVAASLVRPGSVVPAATLTAIVFLQYQPNAPLLLTELHPAEAARLALADSPDAGRFGADGVALAAALCAAQRCVRLVFGDGADAVQAIRTIAAGPARRVGAAVTVLPTTAEPSRDRASSLTDSSVLGLAHGVSGVCVEGRCLLHHRVTGQVIELAEGTSSWLQLLDGRTALADIVDEVAEANDLPAAEVSPTAMTMMQELLKLGVVE